MEFIYFEESWNNHEEVKKKNSAEGSRGVLDGGISSTISSSDDTTRPRG